MQLRKIYLDKQKELSPLERKVKSAQIARLFFANFDLSKINFLHCFLPIEKFYEIETSLIFTNIWQNFSKIKIVVPRVNFQIGEIENSLFEKNSLLKKNQWQIDEPSEGEICDVEKIDLVLVPLLCFDERGFRVGYGKGFYDKFLTKCRPDCLRIALSYFAPVEKISDAQDFDIKLDFCAMPEKIWRRN
jgi:5-formyltetrahydrofolate cyclo-ligase